MIKISRNKASRICDEKVTTSYFLLLVHFTHIHTYTHHTCVRGCMDSAQPYPYYTEPASCMLLQAL